MSLLDTLGSYLRKKYNPSIYHRNNLLVFLDFDNFYIEIRHFQVSNIIWITIIYSNTKNDFYSSLECRISANKYTPEEIVSIIECEVEKLLSIVLTREM